ncbi:MAG: nucleotidyltransferase domain-containing protein [Bacteroidota bacterium]
MIINNVLQHIFSSPSNVIVLRTLNSRMVGVSGREIARISKLSNRTAQSVLANLESLGVVNRTIGGRDHLFTLNRNNKIVSKLIKYIFEFEDGFGKEIISSIKKKLSPIVSSLILFGSVARKEEEYSSDFDLCIVYILNKTKIENAVSELRDKLYDDYKVTLAPFYITETDFKKRAKKNLSPVNNIIKEGILIAGKPIRELIK